MKLLGKSSLTCGNTRDDRAQFITETHGVFEVFLSEQGLLTLHVCVAQSLRVKTRSKCQHSFQTEA